MVKVKAAGIINSISGKLNGSYFRQIGNELVLSKIKPQQPVASYLQNSIRSFHYNLQTAYKSLTDIQRLTWKNASYNGISGYRLFFLCNFYVFQYFQEIITSFPSYPAYVMPSITFISFDIGYGYILFRHSGFPYGSKCHFLFACQNPFIPLGFKSNKYVIISSTIFSGGTTELIPISTWNKVFFKPIDYGDSYPCKLYVYSELIGFKVFLGDFIYSN